MNFEEAAKIAKMMKIMSEQGDISTEEKIIKMTMDYIKPEYRKNAEIIAKYIEFENMAKRHKNAVSAQSGNKLVWQKNMLEDIKKSFDGKKRLKLDMLLKVIELNEIIEKI